MEVIGRVAEEKAAPVTLTITVALAGTEKITCWACCSSLALIVKTARVALVEVNVSAYQGVIDQVPLAVRPLSAATSRRGR